MKKSYSTNGENGNIKSRKMASKNPAVSAMQDLLFYQLTGIGFLARNAQKYDEETNSKITRLLYLTNKNINFSISTMLSAIREADNLKNRMTNLYIFLSANNHKKTKKFPASANIKLGENLSQVVSQANVINAQKTLRTSNINILAMYEIIRHSLCSSANYMEKIKSTEHIPKSMFDILYDILGFLSDDNKNLKEYADFAIKSGELHSQVLELLVGSYERAYGFIERKSVSTDYKKGSAILVIGEDFPFLKKILEETKDKNINIYTYGSLNYAHAFPEFIKYENLVGIYIGKYDDFAANIEAFPGVVVLTTGNLEELTDIYRGRIFSTEDISMLGVARLDKNNIQPLINTAYDAPGFLENQENYNVEIGFGIKELEDYKEKFFNKINENKVNNIVLFLGCDYSSDDKNYLKKFVKNLPQNSSFIILDCISLPCNKSKNQSIILNLGQYINLYILIRLLFAISGKFRKDINDMPVNITINLKNPDTISALLTFLSLGIKNIKINSDLPNYLTNGLINCFNKNYGIINIDDFNNYDFYKKA